jgi:DNA-binding MarR family transcriptional regulator
MKIAQASSSENRSLAILCAMAFAALIADLHVRLTSGGYDDLRPAHGFVFQRVAGTGATAAEIATHLGITRQSTQQILDELELADYLQRVPNPADGRSKRIVLTLKGETCLEIVEAAFNEIDRTWLKQLGKDSFLTLKVCLASISEASNIRGPLRPAW